MAQVESEKIIEKAKKVASEEKDKMMSEVKSEVASLVAVAVEKVIDEKMNDDKDAQIVKEVIR